MPQKVRDIKQEYWRNAKLPHVELRTTKESVQPYKKHSHKQLSIGAIEKGVTRVNYKGLDRIAEVGDLVLIEPQQVHSCNPHEGCCRSYHMLFLDTEWCLEKMSDLYKRPIEHLYCDQFIVKELELFKKYLNVIQALKEQPLIKAEGLLNHLVFIILSSYCAPSLEVRIERQVTQYIRRRLLADLAMPPSLETLANELQYRQETIVRLFKQVMGLAPKEFVNNARIEKAKIMLRAGVDIVDVATEVGFVDQSHFHKAFINYTASTPGQYQRAKAVSENNTSNKSSQ